MKKLLSLILSFALVISLFSILPVKSLAMSFKSEDVKEAIEFLESKNAIVGEIQSIKETDNGIELVTYSENLDIITVINYSILDDGILVEVVEGNKQNKIFYKENGDIFVDGEKLNVTTIPDTIQQKYVYVSYKTLSSVPGTWSNNFVKADTRALEWVLNDVIADYTVSALSQLLSAYLASYGIFISGDTINDLASSIIDKAYQYAKDSKTLYLETNTTENDDQYPLQILYKYDIKFYFAGSVKTSWTGYTLATLI